VTVGGAQVNAGELRVGREQQMLALAVRVDFDRDAQLAGEPNMLDSPAKDRRTQLLGDGSES
jgi:hypothetical protein